MKKIVILVLSGVVGLTASFAQFASAQSSGTTIELCAGDNQLNNIAQITADSDVDVDSTPDNYTVPTVGDTEDDVAQDCTTVNALIDLELSKDISANTTLDAICLSPNDNPRMADNFCLGDPYAGGDPEIVFCGDTIIYELTLTNQGPSTASAEIVVEDTLPGDFTFVSGNVVVGTGTASHVGGVVTWTVTADLAANASTTLEIEGTVGC